MAGRGRKSFTLEEKMERINEQIQEKENELKTLKEQKKQVEKEIRDKQIEKLESAMSEKGLSFEAVMELIEKQK